MLLLLALVVFGVGIVRSFFTPERTRQLLAGRGESAKPLQDLASRPDSE